MKPIDEMQAKATKACGFIVEGVANQLGREVQL
jgi:hypothetical protein